MLFRLPTKARPTVDVALSGQIAAQEFVALNGVRTSLELSQGHILVSEGAVAPQVAQSADAAGTSELVVMVMSRQEFDALLFEQVQIEARVAEVPALPAGTPALATLDAGPQLAALA